MSRIIVDIETSGFELESLDKTTQDYLMQNADSDEEMLKVIQSLSFYPLTAQVVAIGMLNPDTNRGAVYYQTSESVEPFEEDGMLFEGGSEIDILNKFWSVVTKYKQIITFNGRVFDAPFLIIRSAVHKIKPSRDLLPNRYSDSHIDLMDQLSFYGLMKRRFNLDTWCRTFGIESPKSEEMNGYLVPQMFKAGRVEEIARYCVLDLRATRELFFIWKDYIRVSE